MNKNWIFLASLFFIFESHAADRPFESAADIYFEKLALGKFEELDNDWRIIQRDSPTISDGQPLLSSFYGGVSGCVLFSCNGKNGTNWVLRKQKT